MRNKRFFVMAFLMVWGVTIFISFCGMNNANAWGLKGALDKVKNLKKPEPEGETSDEKENEEIRNESTKIGVLGGAFIGNLVGDETGKYIGALIGSIAAKIYAEQMIKLKEKHKNMADTEEAHVDVIEDEIKILKTYMDSLEKDFSRLKDVKLTLDHEREQGKNVDKEEKEHQEEKAMMLTRVKNVKKELEKNISVRKEELENLQKDSNNECRPLIEKINEIEKEKEKLQEIIDANTGL